MPFIELNVKGSRFIGFAERVRSEQEVKEVVQRIHEQHPQSTHVCYAYRLGWEGKIFRAVDDGEPSHSAGTPILQQLVAADLIQSFLAVVRYYGGIQLGVGGLVSAYKQCARGTIEACGFEHHIWQDQFWLSCDYSEMSEVMRICKLNQWEIVETKLTETCSLRLAFPHLCPPEWETYFYDIKTFKIETIPHEFSIAS